MPEAHGAPSVTSASELGHRIAWTSISQRSPGDSVPGQLTELAIENYKPCASGEQEILAGSTTPTLRAKVSDADPDALDAEFEWWTRGGDRVGGGHQSGLPPGSWAQMDIPEGSFVDGAALSWRVRVSDRTDTGLWSAWCHVRIDATAPQAPPTVTSSDYPRGQVSGGVGRTGVFTFNANGDRDVTGFVYGLSDPPVDQVAADQPGGVATLRITPMRRGTNTLYVRSVDAAGHPGPITYYSFRVGSGTESLGHWPLDDHGATATSGNGNDGELRGGATWQQGRIGSGAVSLNGHGTRIVTRRASVPTDRNFTVSAWVRFEGRPVSGVAVSQDGGFTLGYSSDMDTWVFSVPRSGTQVDVAVADARPSTGCGPIWPGSTTRGEPGRCACTSTASCPARPRTPSRQPLPGRCPSEATPAMAGQQRSGRAPSTTCRSSTVHWATASPRSSPRRPPGSTRRGVWTKAAAPPRWTVPATATTAA